MHGRYRARTALLVGNFANIIVSDFSNGILRLISRTLFGLNVPALSRIIDSFDVFAMLRPFAMTKDPIGNIFSPW